MPEEDKRTNTPEMGGEQVAQDASAEMGHKVVELGAEEKQVTKVEHPAKNEDSMSASQSLKPAKKTKRSLGWKIATGVLAVAVLGLAGFLIYHFVATDHSEKQCEEVACEVVEVKDEGTGETVKIVKVPVGNSNEDVAVRALVEDLYNLAEKTLDIYNIQYVYDGAMVLYQPEGWKTAVALNLTYGFEADPDYTNEISGKIHALVSAIKAELAKRGFEEYQYGTLGGGEYINRNTGILCNVGEASLPYGVSCGSVNWYDAENMDLVNELAEAYKEKEGGYPYNIGMIEGVRDSGYEKYQTLHVGIFNAAGEFYRISPDSPWVFFRGGQDAPDCSEYNTEDLKRAFVGATCWNDMTKALDKVKL